MPFKGDMIFRYQPLSLGWVETWYLEAADLSAAIANLSIIASSRVTCSPKEVFMDLIRVSENLPPLTAPPNVRRQRLNQIQAVNLQGSLATSSATSDTAWQAVLIRWQGQVQSIFRMQELRGVPDGIFEDAKFKPNASGFFGALQGYALSLKNNGARLRHKVRGTPPTASYTGVKDFILVRMTHRITGRPLYLPRGRQ